MDGEPPPGKGEFSRVLATPPAPPPAALAYFRQARLACETDPFDVYHDLASRAGGFVLVDARTTDVYDEECLPGALSMPHERMTGEVLRMLDPAPVYVTYGWGPACNAGTRAAAHLAAAGFRVKEMIGGLEYWKRQNYPTTTKRR
ncbi:rhodanese-like domain-containing protein [Streptomyces sp. WMMC940]|uniref:rhodanese-like domain-containing protein n=1 Tax=Streptomyces sp. WMMC940 TaxID=3015153 RepID=UPI0022B65275|nr:rhodanese-like domain-containing protein [Streptomyces sp. WMMC940]MCZ7462278.1 rhodanese-like domain-containing protein [Streptomyces sp. WMMC940]